MIHIVGIASLISGVLAQFLKVVLGYRQTRRFRIERLLDTGGMPSSHTALVTTLAIGVAYYAGIGSAMFSITLIFSM